MNIISYVLQDIPVCSIFISSAQTVVRSRFGCVLSCTMFLAELMGKRVCKQRRVFV